MEWRGERRDAVEWRGGGERCGGVTRVVGCCWTRAADGRLAQGQSLKPLAAVLSGATGAKIQASKNGCRSMVVCDWAAAIQSSRLRLPGR